MCRQTIKEKDEHRTFNEIMIGVKTKSKHTIRKYRYTYSKELRNDYKLIDTKEINGVTVKWWCNKRCRLHCLENFNHCNRGKLCNEKQLAKGQFIKWRKYTYPKDLKKKNQSHTTWASQKTVTSKDLEEHT